jgi:hypothetical protein
MEFEASLMKLEVRGAAEESLAQRPHVACIQAARFGKLFSFSFGCV